MIRRAATSMPIHTTREAAWAMLSQAEKAALWLPGVTAARLLTGEGDISVVEVTIDGAHLVLEIILSPTEGARFEQVDSIKKGAFSGSWRIRDAVDGTPTLDVEIEAATSVFSVGAGRRLRAALDSAMAEIAVRLRRPPTEQLAVYRRALAIIRRGDVIEAHAGDEVIELVSLGGDG